MTDPSRLSVIGEVKINTALDACIVQFGDTFDSDTIDYAIALQRQIPNFRGDETRFASYPIFSLPLPRIQSPDDGILVSRIPESRIYVGDVRVIAIRASSYFQAGFVDRYTAESRILHIRQFNSAPAQQSPFTSQ